MGVIIENQIEVIVEHRNGIRIANMMGIIIANHIEIIIANRIGIRIANLMKIMISNRMGIIIANHIENIIVNQIGIVNCKSDRNKLLHQHNLHFRPNRRANSISSRDALCYLAHLRWAFISSISKHILGPWPTRVLGRTASPGAGWWSSY